jgi:hypothetical protein
MNKDEKKTRKRQQTTDNRQQKTTLHMKFEQTNGNETNGNEPGANRTFLNACGNVQSNVERLLKHTVINDRLLCQNKPISSIDTRLLV